MPTMEKQTLTQVYPANKQIVIDNTKDYVGRLLQDGSLQCQPSSTVKYRDSVKGVLRRFTGSER